MEPNPPLTGSPHRQRRRGTQLEADIFAATLAEIRALGYTGATFEGIARRAGIGRMSLYHRWSGKPQLVAAMLRHALPPLDPLPDEGGLHDELHALLMSMFHTLDDRPIIMIGIAAALLTENADATLAHIVREEILTQRLRRLEDLLFRAWRRGDIAPSVNIALLAQCGPAMLFQQILLSGRLPTEDDVTYLIDELILPSARTR